MFTYMKTINLCQMWVNIPYMIYIYIWILWVLKVDQDGYISEGSTRRSYPDNPTLFRINPGGLSFLVVYQYSLHNSFVLHYIYMIYIYYSISPCLFTQRLYRYDTFLLHRTVVGCCFNPLEPLLHPRPPSQWMWPKRWKV